MSRSILLVALLATALPLRAQTPAARATANQGPADDTSNLYARKSLQVVRIVGAGPSIDGKLEESVWQLSPPATDFIQFEPRPGQPASQKTEIRIAYDDDAFYVGARMYDTHADSIVAQLARRDNEVYSDWIYVAIDSYYDRRTAFAFGVNPKGVKVDVLVFDDTNDDESWDAVWDAATRTDSLGWTAEFRIPFSQLRFSTARDQPDAETVWGFNALRKIARHNEEAWWSPLRRDANAMVSAFGDLRGIAGLKSPRRMEVVPYSMSRLIRAPGNTDNPFYAASDASFGAGADLKLGVTTDLTLTATLNPDFGQVEADPAVVNLTAYETFFPEKRPFFVEGFDIFRVGIGVGDGDGANEGLFYSRRIGRAPQGDVPDRADYADVPEATTILGAAKLSGKTKTGWSIGALSALTGRETAQFTDEQGRGEAIVEPLTHYAIARVNKDFDQGQSAVGGIFTATNRQLPDELNFLRANAYVGGLTGRKRWQNGNYQLTTWLVGTHVNGDTAAINGTQRSSARYFQRPDNDHTDYDPTRTSLNGAGFGAEFFKMGGGHWRYAGLLNVRSPGFEVNDLGFMPSADQVVAVAYVGYRQHEPTTHFNQWNVNVNQWTGWSFGGDRNSFGGNINGSAELKNTAEVWYGVNREQEALSEGATRGGPALLRPGSTNYHAGYDSDERKPVNWWLSLNYSNEDETAGNSIGVYPGLRVRASNQMELRLSPNISWNQRPWQYITTETVGGADYYLFGELHQVTTSLTTRLSYTFSPNLSLQLYAEPFISAGDYRSLSEVVNPRADHFEERFRTYATSQLTYDASDDEYAIDRDGNGSADLTLDNPDFNYRAFRSNLVVRWEYRPGSALFLVWSQGRERSSEYGDYDLGRDASGLFRTRATNVLLVKATYWLGI
jgi:hypothetical protein